MPLGRRGPRRSQLPPRSGAGGGGTRFRPRGSRTPWTPSLPATRPSRISPWPPIAHSRSPVWPRRWCCGARRSSAWPACPSRGPRGRASCRRSATPMRPNSCGPRPPASSARLQGLGALLKGLPLAYNKDLQEDKLYVFASARGARSVPGGHDRHGGRSDLRSRTGARGGRRRLLSGHRCRRLPGRRRVCPFGRRTGSRGDWWRLAARQGRPLAGVTLAELRELSPLFDEDYYPVVDLDHVLAAKISPGGTAPERVTEQLLVARESLARLEADIAAG